jgi:hypothetical protein
MPIPVAPDATFELPPAVPGMIADAMFTDKAVVPCGAAATPFGALVASVAATGISVLPIGANPIEGIAIMDQGIGGRRTVTGAYAQYDAMSVMRRGRIWARAGGACTKDAVAKYDPATGLFADAGTGTLAQAKFLSANISIPGVVSTDSAESVVLVELHSPFVA